MHFAHTLSSQGPEAWEPLAIHLREVEWRAEQAAAAFGADAWGKLAGRWHDLGKYSDAFQKRLHILGGSEAHLEEEGRAERVDHSTAGAQHAVAAKPGLGQLLAFIIAGHHGGLPDSLQLQERLAKRIEPWGAAPAELLESLPLGDPPLSFDRDDKERAGFQLAFFTRMVFSALVDSDFIATEAFMSADQAALRPAGASHFAEMKGTLDGYLDALAARAEPLSFVNQRRQEVLAACRDAASLPPGLFSLTVPTGGGKTLASLAFALHHAQRHGLRRVVYAIPFTSIIEQTADVFRQVFSALGEGVVLEHHSNLELKRETLKSRLAAENWDAPLVVTTNVQLFESLFAARTAPCRKLHNLAGSVLVLDEAQSLPVELLKPCLAALRELAADYRVSVVLCTATQPALLRRDDFPIGLADVQEIIPDQRQLYDDLRRVEVTQIGDQTNLELAAALSAERQVLCIVNTRRHAAELFSLLRKRLEGDVDQQRLGKRRNSAGLYHLSTLMCGEHRARTLRKIRRRLTRGAPCLVISTQLIEAGVDVDFPAVFRSVAGLDSIAQAAGRCNREGRIQKGLVKVFRPIDNPLSVGYIRSCAESMAEIAPDFSADLLDPAAIEAYFQLHYWSQYQDHGCDKPAVMRNFPAPTRREVGFQFKAAAEAFRMIDNEAQQVFVPYDRRAKALIMSLRHAGPSRGILRGLQRYTVGLFERTFREMVAAGEVEVMEGDFAILVNESAYDPRFGLRTDRPGFYEPEALIA
jgi:CRISPR-associated endonuclease/helicase Cas3